jgi:hypothetical protein
MFREGRVAAQSNALSSPNSARADFLGDADRVIDPVSRLSAIHAEAEETALLANLLGRTLYAGLVLAGAAGLAIAVAQAPLAREISWGLLMLIGSGALIWSYVRTIRTSFERAALRNFGEDLSAILFYAGFAWGAGAFLILPPDASPTLAILFSACTAVVIASILRAREPVVIFVVPVGLLTALAAFLRPFPAAELTASLAVTCCAFVTGAVLLSEWIARKSRSVPQPRDALSM